MRTRLLLFGIAQRVEQRGHERHGFHTKAGPRNGVAQFADMQQRRESGIEKWQALTVLTEPCSCAARDLTRARHQHRYDSTA